MTESNYERITTLLSHKDLDCIKQGLDLLKTQEDCLQKLLFGVHINSYGLPTFGEELNTLKISYDFRDLIALSLLYMSKQLNDISTLCIRTSLVDMEKTNIMEMIGEQTQLNKLTMRISLFKGQELCENGTTKLAHLFDKLKGLQSLVLDTGDGRILSAPANINSLLELQTLDLHGTKVPQEWDLSSLSKLQILKLHACGLKTLPNIQGLNNVYWVSIYNNPLDSLEGIQQLHNLKTLNLTSNRLTELPDLSTLTQLTTIDLNGNPNLSNIDGLQNCTALKKISLARNNDLNSLSALQNLTSLETLDISHTSQIADGGPLLKLPSLQKLFFDKATAIQPQTFPSHLILHKYKIELKVGAFTLCWQGPLRYREDSDHHSDADPHWNSHIAQAHWVEKDGVPVSPVITDWCIIRKERYYSSYYTAWHEGFVVIDNEVLFRGKASSDYHNLNHKYYKLNTTSGTHNRSEFQQDLTSPVEISGSDKGQFLPIEELIGFQNYQRTRENWIWSAEQNLLQLGSVE